MIITAKTQAQGLKLNNCLVGRKNIKLLVLFKNCTKFNRFVYYSLHTIDEKDIEMPPPQRAAAVSHHGVSSHSKHRVLAWACKACSQVPLFVCRLLCLSDLCPFNFQFFEAHCIFSFTTLLRLVLPKQPVHTVCVWELGSCKSLLWNSRRDTD